MNRDSPEPVPASPIHVDDYLLVLEKPAGLLCVPGRGDDKQDCLAARTQALFPDALVVHRLDMATSGLWLMARGIDMQRRLNSAFAERRIDKRYLAVVAGRLALPASAVDGWSIIDLPLAADWPNRPRSKIDNEHGKASLTRWRPLGHDTQSDTTRLELVPETGRSHQLRVHLQALGHPILGDMLYAPPHVAAASERLLLHASALSLIHPVSNETLSFTSTAPF